MMKYGIELVEAPAAEPVALVGDIKAQSRILEWDAEDGLVSSYIRAAREFVETVTGRQIMRAKYRMTLDAFPYRLDRRNTIRAHTAWGEIRLPRPPLISIDEVKYIDTDGVLQTLASSEYQWSATQITGRLRPARLKYWPPTDPYSLDAVRIVFTCGYVDVDSVPDRVKQCIRLLVAHMFEHREAAAANVSLADLPFGVKALLNSVKTGEYV